MTARINYTPSRTTICDNCRWWSGSPDSADGECRRRSPHTHTQYGPGYAPGVAVWPETEWDNWCGDFESRKEKG